MASVTSLGTGSGLDLESIVTKLMKVEQQPITLLQSKEAKESTKLSALGQIKSALSSFQSVAEALDTRSEFGAYKASIADSGVASVAVSSSAVSGNYSLEVTQLAASQKIKSSGYASSTTAITGNTLPATLTLEVGKTSDSSFTASATKTITIDSSNNSLEGMRDAINAAKTGVTASIVNDGGSTPYRLVLSTDSTGTASSFKLSGLSDFSYDPATANGTGLSTVTSAADSKFKIDGTEFVKSSNSVTDAVQGMTLSLSKTNIGSATTITVAQDTSAIETKVSAFVSAYNALNTLAKSLTSYNTETKVSGTLNGDSTVRSIQSQLKNAISSMVGSGSANRLAQIGIQFQKDGSLKLDSTKFQAALKDTTKDVAGLFVKDTKTGVTGVASLVSSRITEMLGTDGLLTARTDGINKTIKSMDKRIDTLESRLTTIEARYRKQFTALDTTIASLNKTSSYLTQQLKALSNSKS